MKIEYEDLQLTITLTYSQLAKCTYNIRISVSILLSLCRLLSAMVTFVLHRFFFLIFSTFAYLVPVILATVFTDPAQLVKKEYDFVVVGGGTAGNVLANRLTNGTNFTVLVIEAGITSVYTQ